MRTALIGFLLMLMMSSLLIAQDDQREQMLEEERREQGEEMANQGGDPVDNTLPSGDGYVSASQELFWDVGGWYTFEFLQFDDEPFKDQRTERFHDFRFWGNATYRGAHRLYVRTKANYTDFNSGESFDDDDNDFSDFKTDQLFFEWDLGSFLYDFGYLANAKVTAGRQFGRIGGGFTYNKVADGVTFQGTYEQYSYKAFGMRSIHSSSDIDSTRPGGEHSDRTFWGLQLAYGGWGKHRPTVYALFQRDSNGDEDGLPAQEFDYNTNHFGVQLKGDLIPRVAYSTEFVWQSGESGADGTNQTEDIDAFGLKTTLEWWPNTMEPNPPRFHVGWLYGSGDADRSSVAGTVGGNTAGSDDEGFTTFGYALTGFSLAPKVSNLHILRAGVGFSPFYNERSGNLRRFRANFTLYQFMKDETDGGISDLRATEDEDDVGTEIDVSISYRAMSDLGFTLRYGMFLPGEAYNDANDDSRAFLSLGFTYTF